VVGVLPALPDIREGTCVVDCLWLVRGLFCSCHSTIISFLYGNLFLCKDVFCKVYVLKKKKSIFFHFSSVYLFIYFHSHYFSFFIYLFFY